MTGRDAGRLGTRSGQFFVWRFLGGRGWTRGHPYSRLGRSDRPTPLRVTVAGPGDGTPAGARAARRHPGAPRGALRRVRPATASPPPGADAGRRGRGDAVPRAGRGRHARPGRGDPGRPLADGPGVLAEELAELCAQRGVELVVLAGPRRTELSWLPEGVEGGPAEVLARLVPDVAERDVFLCGPPGWTRSGPHGGRAGRRTGPRPAPGGVLLVRAQEASTKSRMPEAGSSHDRRNDGCRGRSSTSSTGTQRCASLSGRSWVSRARAGTASTVS